MWKFSVFVGLHCFFIQLLLNSEKWSGSSKESEWIRWMVAYPSWVLAWSQRCHGFSPILRKWFWGVAGTSVLTVLEKLRIIITLPACLNYLWINGCEGVKWGWVCTSRFQVVFLAVSPSRDAQLRGSGKAGKPAPPALWPGGSCWRPPAHRLPQTACPLNGSSWTEYCGTQRPSRSFQLSCTVLLGLCSHIPVHCNPPRTVSCLKGTTDMWLCLG